MTSQEARPPCSLRAERQGFEVFLEQVTSKACRGQAKARLTASLAACRPGALTPTFPALPGHGGHPRTQTSSPSPSASLEVDTEAPEWVVMRRREGGREGKRDGGRGRQILSRSDSFSEEVTVKALGRKSERPLNEQGAERTPGWAWLMQWPGVMRDVGCV